MLSRASGAVPPLQFHSNTIVVASNGTAGASASGVEYRSAAGATTALSGGSWTNNIIWAEAATTGFVLREASTLADPVSFGHNLLFAGGSTRLYLDEDTTLLTSPSAIDTLVDLSAGGTLSQDPILSANYHLQSSSPARGAGTATAAPVVDFDGDARPNPLGSNPDIGADEVP